MEGRLREAGGDSGGEGDVEEGVPAAEFAGNPFVFVCFGGEEGGGVVS